MHKPFLARGQNEIDRELWSSLQLVTPEDQSRLRGPLAFLLQCVGGKRSFQSESG